MPLSPDDFLEDGETYTFSVTSHALYSSVDEVTSKVSQIVGIGNVTVVQVGSGTIFSPRFDITFRFSEIISYSIQDMAQAIITALSSWFSSFVFVSASQGTSNTSNQGVTSAPSPLDSFSGILPSTTWIIAAVVGLGIVAFLASGGATAVRRATGG